LESHCGACWSRPLSLELNLLPGFQLHCSDHPVALPLGAQRLLAYLALRKVPLVRAHVSEALWPEADNRRASANLRSAIWRVRQAGHNALDATGNRLGLTPGVVVDFQEAAALARRILDRSAPWPDGTVGQEVATKLSTDLLQDWYDDWLLLERERWNQLRLHALEALAERLLACGELSQAVEAALAAVWTEPLRESAQRILIRVHAAEGNLCEAVAQYRRYQQLLRHELSTSPTAQMEQLIHELAPRMLTRR
jgi:DNA-binding SARP family transcriptional activator